MLRLAAKQDRMEAEGEQNRPFDREGYQDYALRFPHDVPTAFSPQIHIISELFQNGKLSLVTLV